MLILAKLCMQEAPDILSHCAVRARNFGVLLATCSLEAEVSQQKIRNDYNYCAAYALVSSIPNQE